MYLFVVFKEEENFKKMYQCLFDKPKARVVVQH